ncbi:eukaryotic translation initiation factor 2 (eIF-2) family protein [Raphanus sativus]|uniref:Eukaryotic translation initiation factor 5B n=1 Tax=Raphanus sativus TaxID=3726 RepID=A0A9W3CP34_RAPSA|nr:eukaryotic translation initiation factor 5B-like isoform X2 [Raphanus sativus]KAJ4871689.1 eukaryotic translation initiation factor 2 (eIF-2) family protein [Raphanus sativus]
MDRENTSACGGDENHPFALSSKGSENPNKVVITGKKKKGKKVCKPHKEEKDDHEIAFSGEDKLKSKNVGFASFDLLGVEDDDISAEVCDELILGRQVTEETNTKSEDAGGTSRSKKKKNKSGKTAHEEEDLDKILAELGITPVSPAQPELVAPADGSKDEGEEETVLSVSAKKRKKKKDKDKDKKVSASSMEEAKEEPSQHQKKVPKHVLEMQEMVARRKEAEEMKKKEEEEKFRKEEEERRMQEEREREAEEIKQKRKMRAKEKLQKKKQEGGILTEKQKRDKAFKNKILSDAGMLLASDKNSDSSKRPVYGNKRKPARGKANDSASEVVPTLHEGDSTELDKKQEAGDEEDDWEAKSDDSVDIMGDYDDDGEDVPWLVVKKEIKETASKAHCSGPVTDTLALKAGVSCRPQKSIPNVDDATRPKDANVSVVNEVVEESLRSPICCIMGHVDTGKTKLLDCIRGTNVQEGEAGGITQQIGATYFPAENIRERTKELKPDAKLKVPGLLVIDTPGHESFSNLRSRGSNLCDIAILVVDIMHGLEPQTIESLNLLRKRNTEFIVALNKIDRLYGWKTSKNAPIEKALALQSKDVVIEFNMRLTHVITQFKEQGLNTEIYYKNREMGDTISIVPTSAISGEGIPDLLLYLVMWSQKTMVEKLTFVDKVQCTVLEVKVIPGHGTTIDVVLVNGVLHEGDQIVACGSQGPIVTTVRSLLTPHPMKELRVKGTYLHHREVKAAQCIKITAQGLEHAVAGTSLHVIGPDVDVEEAKKTAMEDMKSIMSWVDKSGEGVYVQASTLGSLEALLEFLKSPDVKIPVSGIGLGPVHKKDIMKAGVMLEKKKEYATILAFDVKITTEARELADNMGVKIFCADIIYHLFDQFKGYVKDVRDEERKETAAEVVFPCVLKILPDHVFKRGDPIILGVEVIDGILKVGTPMCFLKEIEKSRVFVDLGRVASIHKDKKPLEDAKKGQQVAIKIIASNPGEEKTFGEDFGIEDELVSHISRRSIDILKTLYRNELKDEFKLVKKLKTLFKIQ